MTTRTLKTVTTDAVIRSVAYGGNGVITTQSTLPGALVARILGNRFIDMPDTTLNRMLGYRYSTVPAPVPQSSNREVELARKRHSNRDFKKLQAAGAVVVSPYMVDTISIYAQQGATVTGRTVLVGTGSSTYAPYLGFPIVTDSGPGKFRGALISGRVYDIPSWYCSYTNDPPTFSAIADDPALFSSLTSPQGLDDDYGALLQDAVQKVNGKSVDALTAIAELPETVREIFHLLHAIAGAVKSFKGSRARILLAGERERERIQLAFTKKIKEMISLRPGDRRSASKLNRDIARARRTLTRDLRNVSVKTASSVAGAWLTLRYGVMPNVYLIQDLAKASKRLHWQRLSESSHKDLTFAPASIEGWVASGSGNLKVTAFCQASINPGNNPIGALSSVASFDLLTTAWELVPLSFVVDWVFGVGNFVASLSPPANMIDRGITLSYRWQQTTTYTNTLDGATVTVVRNFYQREVKSTEDFSGVYLNVNMNWKRQLDAAALTWGLVIKPMLRRQ